MCLIYRFWHCNIILLLFLLHLHKHAIFMHYDNAKNNICSIRMGRILNRRLWIKWNGGYSLKLVKVLFIEFYFAYLFIFDNFKLIERMRIEQWFSFFRYLSKIRVLIPFFMYSVLIWSSIRNSEFTKSKNRQL